MTPTDDRFDPMPDDPFDELRRALDVRPSPSFEARVLAQIDDVPARRRPWLWPVLAVAAGLVAVVVGWRLGGDTRAPARVEVAVQEGARPPAPTVTSSSESSTLRNRPSAPPAAAGAARAANSANTRPRVAVSAPAGPRAGSSKRPPTRVREQNRNDAGTSDELDRRVILPPDHERAFARLVSDLRSGRIVLEPDAFDPPDPPRLAFNEVKPLETEPLTVPPIDISSSPSTLR